MSEFQGRPPAPGSFSSVLTLASESGAQWQEVLTEGGARVCTARLVIYLLADPGTTPAQLTFPTQPMRGQKNGMKDEGCAKSPVGGMLAQLVVILATDVT
ncbi:hypothetical protein B0H13DRAFT_2338832 [Mycena leptocephala]|nr:hypothetical protein B0H13DRAFT_2338832 [Mycena leptocephala]